MTLGRGAQMRQTVHTSVLTARIRFIRPASAAPRALALPGVNCRGSAPGAAYSTTSSSTDSRTAKSAISRKLGLPKKLKDDVKLGITPPLHIAHVTAIDASYCACFWEGSLPSEVADVGGADPALAVGRHLGECWGGP